MQHVRRVVVLVVLWLVAGGMVGAQGRQPDAPPRTTIEMTGCVSLTPVASGQFAMIDSASGGRYRLSGKGIGKYAGKRVVVVGGPRVPRRLGLRFGLWPSPNVAARAGAMDPAEESIARQPGGAAGPAESNLPEFQVRRIRGVEGGCR